MEKWDYLKGNERKEAKKRILQNFNKQGLEEIKRFVIDNIKYCKKHNHKNLNYWKYELKFVNECLKEV